jgi:NAD(P)-dependent dehydrogenase (short-subunit alcohol dehydrogenase family)
MSSVYKIELTGKTVVITGGYGHLGTAIVESLVVHGGNVYVLGRDRNKFSKSFGDDKVKFVNCDVAQTASIEKAFEEVAQKAGVIDVLINSAFYSKGQSPLAMSDEDWATGIDGTLGNVFRCMRAIIPHMNKQKSGKVINVSSMYGMIAPDFSIYDESPDFLNPPHYGAAKAGVLQLTRYYASYLGKSGITVNSVTPGPFPSDAVQKDRSFIEKLSSKTILGRVGKPKDLAGIFVFLSSDSANYITGQNFVVDGGWTTR